MSSSVFCCQENQESLFLLAMQITSEGVHFRAPVIYNQPVLTKYEQKRDVLSSVIRIILIRDKEKVSL